MQPKNSFPAPHHLPSSPEKAPAPSLYTSPRATATTAKIAYHTSIEWPLGARKNWAPIVLIKDIIVDEQYRPAVQGSLRGLTGVTVTPDSFTYNTKQHPSLLSSTSYDKIDPNTQKITFVTLDPLQTYDKLEFALWRYETFDNPSAGPDTYQLKIVDATIDIYKLSMLHVGNLEIRIKKLIRSERFAPDLSFCTSPTYDKNTNMVGQCLGGEFEEDEDTRAVVCKYANGTVSPTDLTKVTFSVDKGAYTAVYGSLQIISQYTFFIGGEDDGAIEIHDTRGLCDTTTERSSLSGFTLVPRDTDRAVELADAPSSYLDPYILSGHNILCKDSSGGHDVVSTTAFLQSLQFNTYLMLLVYDEKYCTFATIGDKILPTNCFWVPLLRADWEMSSELECDSPPCGLGVAEPYTQPYWKNSHTKTKSPSAAVGAPPPLEWAGDSQFYNENFDQYPYYPGDAGFEGILVCLKHSVDV